MQIIDDIKEMFDIERIKKTPWEEKSMTEIQMLRAKIKGVIWQSQALIGGSLKMALKNLLREQLTGPNGHASDQLAVRMFNHYLEDDGEDFMLTLDDMKTMNAAKQRNSSSVDVRFTLDSVLNPNWHVACGQAKSTGYRQTYNGKMNSLWDNGAISTYTVKYFGEVKASGKSCEWIGTVEYYDRFDLDPHWGWSQSNHMGRSAGGERRTRIGYMLDLGTDFNMISPKANASQKENDNSVTFAGSIIRGSDKAPSAGDA